MITHKTPPRLCITKACYLPYRSQTQCVGCCLTQTSHLKLPYQKAWRLDAFVEELQALIDLEAQKNPPQSLQKRLGTENSITKKPMCRKTLAKSKNMCYNILRASVIRLYRSAVSLLCRAIVLPYNSPPFSFVYTFYHIFFLLSIVNVGYDYQILIYRWVFAGGETPPLRRYACRGGVSPPDFCYIKHTDKSKFKRKKDCLALSQSFL